MAINDSMLKSNQELRSDARQQLEAKWGSAVIASLVYAVITGTASGAGGIGALIIGGPMELGLATYVLLLKKREDAQLEHLFRGFRTFESSLVLYLVRSVFIALWSLLFVIPGIVAALRYSMSIYILHDNPEISGMDALNRSKEMMDGFKGRLFGLYLSFLGWAILCLFTLGIGYLWLIPYMKVTEANFYEDLKNAQKY